MKKILLILFLTFSINNYATNFHCYDAAVSNNTYNYTDLACTEAFSVDLSGFVSNLGSLNANLYYKIDYDGRIDIAIEESISDTEHKSFSAYDSNIEFDSMSLITSLKGVAWFGHYSETETGAIS